MIIKYMRTLVPSKGMCSESGRVGEWETGDYAADMRPDFEMPS